MSQLMRYHKYPTAGVGTGPYTITVDGNSQTAYLRGNGSGGAYVWSDMLLAPSSGATTAQRQAIGNLTHDAGLSVNMDYTADGSGANTLAAADAFLNTFGYSNAKKGYNSGNNLPNTERNNMVNPNLHAKYPIIFGITGSPGGHAIVCDGYGYASSTMYHHLNLGWDGSDDAWYNLPTIDTSQGTFTSVYRCIYNVYTSGSGEIIAGRVTSGGSPVSGVTVTATRSGGGTYNALTDPNGIYAITKVPWGSNYTVSASKTGYTFASQAASTGTSSDYSTTTGNLWQVDFVAGSAPTLTSRVLFNSGPLVNSPGTGAGGADESIIPTALGLSTHGFGNQVYYGNRIADDFKLTSRSQLQKIKFYAYQTNSTTTSTITAVNLRIWNGPPNNPASTVIYGDTTTTNRLVNTTWANIYRGSTSGTTNRPVMLVTAGVDITLNPGTYWLDWQVDGSTSFSGPWASPITKNGQTTTGNALQYSGGAWTAVLDAGTNTQQGFPFIIEGVGGANLAPFLLLLLN